MRIFRFGFEFALGLVGLGWLGVKRVCAREPSCCAQHENTTTNEHEHILQLFVIKDSYIIINPLYYMVYYEARSFRLIRLLWQSWQSDIDPVRIELVLEMSWRDFKSGMI